MATQGTAKLLSLGSGEDLGNCCQLPSFIKSPKTVNSTMMLVVDVETFDVSWRHLSRDQSTVICWSVNIFLFCCLLTQKLQNYRATVKNE